MTPAWKASLETALWLVVGLIAMSVTKNILGLTGEGILVAVLALPTLLYMVWSGRISELKAPGGLEAKFVNASKRSVGARASKTAVREITHVEKSSVSNLQSLLPGIETEKTVVLTMKLGGDYDAASLAQYLNTLLAYRQFRFVVILDRKDRFVGSIPIDVLDRAADLAGLANIVALINAEMEGDLEAHPLVITDFVTAGTSNIDALKQMRAQYLRSIVVLDNRGRLEGMIDRDDVLSDLLLEMSS